MTNSIKSAFHTEIASTVLNEILYQRSNYYYYLGKLEKWGNTDVAPIGELVDSYLDNAAIRNNMVYVKRITANDITLVIDKYDWVAGTVYDYWDSRKQMKGLPFYCVTTDFNVYKCLDNAGGVPSTSMPTQILYNAFKTADGYTWKYMYNIPPFKRLKFKSVEYIPVQRALTDSFYNKGSVEDVVVTANGSGYTDVALSYITVTPTGLGSGAILVPIITREDRVAELNSAGQVIVPARSRGTIIGVTIVNGGIDYVTAPTITVVDTLNTGIGIYGNPAAVLTAIVHNGSIVNVTIEDPGKLYSVDNNTTITVDGDGVGASFSPVVHNGIITDVVVENAGNGYSYMVLTVSGSGTGALIKPVLGMSDFISDQSIIEQTTTIGGLFSIQVTNGGSNYSEAAAVVVNGDWSNNSGTECLAAPVIVNGVITHIVISQFGAGYTYANIVITDVQGVGAAATAILAPVGGHGKDAIVELLAETLAINSSLGQDNVLNKLTQDYRQYGIIKNPTNIITGQTFRNNSMLIAYEVIFDHVTDLANLLSVGIEDILLLGEFKFRVIAIDGFTVTLQPMDSNYVIPVGILYSTNTVNVYSSTSVVSQPSINKHSGKLLYVSNELPFSFTENQGIVIKTFLKF